MAKFIGAVVASFVLLTGTAYAEGRAGLGEQLKGVNPFTAEGGEKTVAAVHEALFNPGKRDLPAARSACQSALRLAMKGASRLPFRIQIKGVEATAECAFIRSRHEEARDSLRALVALCRPDDCFKRLHRAYALVRRWMWPNALKAILSAPKEALHKGAAYQARARYKTHLEKVTNQLDALQQLKHIASRSLAKRRGKGGFIVESFPGKAGGAWGGLRVGDVILSIGGRTIRNMVDFKARLKELAVPDSGNRSIYFLREGLGYERNIGQGKPGVRVIEVPENEGL